MPRDLFADAPKKQPRDLFADQPAATAAAEPLPSLGEVTSNGDIIEMDPMRGERPMVAPKESPTGYKPSMVPLLDPVNAFGTSVVENIPVVGGPLNAAGNQVDAWIASLIEGREVTPEERERITQSEQEEFPWASVPGGAVGLLGPLGALSKIPMVGRALGMTGGLPARMGFGAASGGTLSGLDALTRGGDAEDAMLAFLTGGGVGLGFPVAGRVVGNVIDRFAGNTVPAEMRNLARALSDDDVPVDQIKPRLADMGDGAMVMDLGPNAQAQAGALASVPGNAQKVVRDAVTGRRKATSDRVTADVAETIGTSPDITQITDEIVAAQKAAADPLYTAIRDVAIEVPPALNFVLKTPMGKQAFEAAKRLAANDGYTTDRMTVGLVDYVKRALDDIAATSGRSGEGNLSRQARNMTKAITSAVDAQVPGYKAARDAFAGPAQVLDAVEQGQAAFTKEMSPSQLKSALDGMSPSERDGFLAGARASIEATMGNAVNDALSLRNTFRKGWNESKLRLLLGNDVADDLLKRMDREAAFSRSDSVVSGGSETARRLAAQGEVAPGMRDLNQVSALGLLFGAINKARAGIRGKVQPKINARHAAALTAGADDVDALLEMLTTAGKPRKNALIAPAAPAVALTGGSQ